jgi:hypothetical protein
VLQLRETSFEDECNLPECEQGKANGRPGQVQRGHLVCALCHASLNTTEGILKVPCSQGHMFHSSCIRGWLETHSTCPVDQQNLSAPIQRGRFRASLHCGSCYSV